MWFVWWTISGLIFFWLLDSIVIICTNFIGSYCFFRGISMFFGGFPTEIEMINMIKTGTAEFMASFLWYLAGIVIMTVACFKLQYCNKSEKDDNYVLLN
mmetsp:Transcript_17872/g.12830  ORF Transcript_17872/g.12830 Transcript_17872/m.12830 type:complete len:99 (-) Transcript_17872:18-314(-)